MGVTATFQAMTQLLTPLSDDGILTFDWSCQLSGSKSNSMNLHKLLDRFSWDWDREGWILGMGQ